MHIYAIGYLKKEALCFTKITGDEKIIEDGGEAETVSNLEEENKKKRALRKKKKNTRVLSFTAARPSASASAVSVPWSAPLFASVSASPVFVLGSSAFLSSVYPSASGVFVSVPGSSALLLSALPSTSGVSLPLLGSSASPSVLSVFAVSVSVPRLSVLLSVSGVPVPLLELSSLPFFIWSFLQTPTPVPERQRLGHWSGILKKTSSEEAPTTFASLFLPSECPSPLLFPSSGIGEKRPFDKAFNIDCQPLADNYVGKDVGKRKFDKTFISTWPLTNNHVKKEVDLRFAGCRCSLGAKLNRPWQIELLEQRSACIVETISLAAVIFWDPNFMPCLRHTLNLAKKMGLKTRNLSSALVKERIQSIWANKTIGQLDALFKENPDWWSATAVIYSQPSVRNIKK